MLLATERPALVACADAIVERLGDGLRCWGDLADALPAILVSDADWIAFARVLFELGDRRALVLLFDVVRGRDAVVRAMIGDADRLSPALQRALVVLALPPSMYGAARTSLGPSARELLDADVRVRARDEDLYRAHVQALRAQRAATSRSVFPTVTSRNPEVPEATTAGDLS
ncbi:MAG: hypothetical protein ACHREM_12740 [Polyangiales bacterium]